MTTEEWRVVYMKSLLLIISVCLFLYAEAFSAEPPIPEGKRLRGYSCGTLNALIEFPFFPSEDIPFSPVSKFAQNYQNY
jgi:hypothetical protein